MPELPPVGSRVSLRYRLPVGSVPPLTDVIGHLLAIGPTLSVRTKRGDVVDVASADVVAIKALAAAPVRTGDIRNIEYAAALARSPLDIQVSILPITPERIFGLLERARMKAKGSRR